MESNWPQAFLMLILKKYHHSCRPLNDFSFSKETPIASSRPYGSYFSNSSLFLSLNWNLWLSKPVMMLTTSKVSAIRRVENHLLYLVCTPPYPRKLAALSRCKSAPDINTGKLILESRSNCCPQKRLYSLEASWSCWPFPLPPPGRQKNQAIHEKVTQMPWFASWHIKVTQAWFMSPPNSNLGVSSFISSSPILYVLRRHNLLRRGMADSQEWLHHVCLSHWSI